MIGDSRLESGVVFNIQRFSLHDGPGIRTTVFLKGCPLRCRWCANPESQETWPQLMVREATCRRCGACAKVCPRQAIIFSKAEGRRIAWDRCDQCLKCVEACIYESLGVAGTVTTVEDTLKEALADEVFYQTSGGGVTLSGGEPLAQPAFLRSLLRGLKERKVHTAVDTSGLVAEEVWREILPDTDLILYDLKHLDADRHREFTGVDNRLILANLRLAVRAVRTWLRLPVIPGFNDSPEHIKAVAQMVGDLGVEKVSLLPYHEGGWSKAHQIGRAYDLVEAKTPPDEHIQELRLIVAEVGVVATVGY